MRRTFGVGVMLTAVAAATAWTASPAAAQSVRVEKVDLTRTALSEEGFELRWTNTAPLAQAGAGPIEELYLIGAVVLGRTKDNFLVAFDADSGAFRWIRPVGRPDRKMFPPTHYLDTFATKDKDLNVVPTLYVVVYDELYAINALTGKNIEEYATDERSRRRVSTGEVRRPERLPFLPSTGLVRDRDVAVIAGANQRVYFVDGDKYYRIFNRLLNGPVPYTPLMSDLNEKGVRGQIFFGDYTGHVYAYSPERAMYWEFPSNQTEAIGRLSAPMSKVPSPYQLLLVPTDDNSLFALRQSDGVKRWQKRSNVPFREAATAVLHPDQDRVYVRNEERTMYALNAGWSTQAANQDLDVWELPEAGKFLTAARNSQFSVFLLNPDNTISEVVSVQGKSKAKTGDEKVTYSPKVRARYLLGDLSIFAPNPEDPVLFAATPDGRFYSIKLGEGDVLERRKTEQPYVTKLTPGKVDPNKKAAAKPAPAAKEEKKEEPPAEEKKEEKKAKK